MFTLLEFVSFTKGVEYLIAIVFVMGFLVFWQIAYGRGRFVKVAPLIIAMLGILVLLGSCVSSAPAVVPLESGKTKAVSPRPTPAYPITENGSSRVR